VKNASFAFDDVQQLSVLSFCLILKHLKSGQYVVKAVIINSSGLHDGLALRTSLQRKKLTAICCAIQYTEMIYALAF